MINYIEKGANLHAEIENSGYRLWQLDDVFYSDNDEAVQLIIDNYDPLPKSKIDTKSRVKQEASKRVAVIYPFIDPTSEHAIGLYDFTTDIYLSIKAASRNALSGRLLEFKNIYDAAQSAISDIDSMIDWQAIDDYDAVNTPTWP